VLFSRRASALWRRKAASCLRIRIMRRLYLQAVVAASATDILDCPCIRSAAKAHDPISERPPRAVFLWVLKVKKANLADVCSWPTGCSLRRSDTSGVRDKPESARRRLLCDALRDVAIELPI
jgi:hypothetical protein